jgi:hypothetical protein
MPRALWILCITAALPAAAAAGERVGPSASRDAEAGDASVELEAADEARELAESYLRAITNQGSEQALDSLLGGATLTLLDMESYRIVGREEHRHERGELAELHAHVGAIDRAGRDAFSRITGGGSNADGLSVEGLSAEQAAKLQAPTKARADAFTKSNPLFAYIARVDKRVYWNPKNPFRKLLAVAGRKGGYQADLDLFWVETVDRGDPEKKARRWPLRVVRFQASSLDTGLKILPAASWDAE